MFLQLGGLGAQVALQVVHVALDEQRAVVQVVDAPFRKRIAGKLS